MLWPEVVFVAPKDIIHTDIANELGALVIGRNTGHLWEQADLPLYMAKTKRLPLLNLANTAPLLYSNNYITIHDLAFYHHPEWNSKSFATWYNVLVPRLAYGSRHIFTVSQTMKQEINGCYGMKPEKITVTYNGISKKMQELVAGSSVAKEKMILTVGSFNKRKNHAVLLQAYLQSNIKTDYQLVIIGDKSKVFSEGGIDEQTVQDNNIKIYQHLLEAELVAMYLRAEAVVSLSAYEGFGIPVLEGLYCGCKAIVSDIPVYKELYSGNATFCDPGKMSSVVAALDGIGSMAVPDASPLFEKFNYPAAASEIINVIGGKL